MTRKTEQDLTKLADAAFKQSAKKVVELAIRTGTPVIVWDGKAVKRVPPTEFLKDRKSPRKKARKKD